MVPTFAISNRRNFIEKATVIQWDYFDVTFGHIKSVAALWAVFIRDCIAAIFNILGGFKAKEVERS